VNGADDLTALLGVSLPVVQAGMGGIAGPELVRAVAEGGGLGVLGLYKMTPAVIGDVISELQSATHLRFGVNFIPELMDPAVLNAQLSAALDVIERPTCFLFYGPPPPATVGAIRRSRLRHVLSVQVGSRAQIDSAAGLDADFIVLQDADLAGGHLLGECSGPELLSYARHCRPDWPLVAAGAVSTHRDAKARFQQGYSGVLAGTVFVATVESQAHEVYKQRLCQSTRRDLLVTDRFGIGWPERRHRIVAPPIDLDAPQVRADFIASVEVGGTVFPVPRFSAVVPSRSARGRVSEMVMYAGMGLDRITSVRPAGQVVRNIARDEGFDSE
jgi:nitronate monooxygenase